MMSSLSSWKGCFPVYVSGMQRKSVANIYMRLQNSRKIPSGRAQLGPSPRLAWSSRSAGAKAAQPWAPQAGARQRELEASELRHPPEAPSSLRCRDSSSFVRRPSAKSSALFEVIALSFSRSVRNGKRT